jgi:acetolactate synthase-1/3 small subunit
VTVQARAVTLPAGEPDAVQGRHVVSALVIDRPGTLSRVSGLLRARSFNIESLTVGATHEPGQSRMTIVLRGDEGHLRQVLAQLQRLIDVLEVADLHETPHLERELALVELDAPADADAERRLRAALADAGVGAEAISTDADGWRVSLTTSPGQLDDVLETLRDLGLRRSVRGGAVAMTTQSPAKNGASPT